MTLKPDPSSLSRALGARRQTQPHFDRLNRQIAARAGRQAQTVRAARRLPLGHCSRLVPSDKLLWLERVECLTFERWNEFDALAVRLLRHDQMIELLRQGDLGGKGHLAGVGGHSLARPMDGDGDEV
ncbi:hypothetical protein [Rhizobium sp. AAP43]|uniref:hypothetical protein n=1 Tax=Rhizobium sp. AAP43 TaxID=1523420 RepID=UPI0006B9BA7C|nr:hypothetical protein [Rhizobium sp. AAP43]